jgi:hypothetical protein
MQRDNTIKSLVGLSTDFATFQTDIFSQLNKIGSKLLELDENYLRIASRLSGTPSDSLAE